MNPIDKVVSLFIKNHYAWSDNMMIYKKNSWIMSENGIAVF